MEFQAFWAEMWARCGPAPMGFEQCEAARDVYEKAKAAIEDAERERWAHVFDGLAVLNALTPEARKRLGYAEVSDVLDAVAKLSRA